MDITNIIVPEGRDDKAIIHRLLIHHNLQSQIEFAKDVEGVEQLLTGLRTRLRPGSQQRFAIVVDADAPNVLEEQQFAARWQSIRDRLARCGYQNLPQNPLPEGTIVEDDDLPRVGVWLMPNNQSRGMLEDFAITLMRDEHGLFSYAQHCVENLPARLFRPSFQRKAEVHTWLAWQERPGLSFWGAVQERYFHPEAPEAQLFVAWMRRVFDL